MCNLYRMKSNIEAMRRLFGPFVGDTDNLPLFEGIYPNRPAPVLRNESDKLTLETMIWGVPPPGTVTRPITNVRNLQSSFWRSMLANPERRCLVPVTEFCEWEGEIGRKRQVWFTLTNPDEVPFAFAGLWRPTENGPRMAFLTCEANATVGAVHPKAMPVILDRADYTRWLSGSFEEVCPLAKPCPDDGMAVSGH